mmetsp:Transcript_31705/g.67133  ORF Transcript_31705/g.67133 Transcript_31705/m.67133 type:complete len:270 (-) Transcript_31705:528-1337(-)
MFQHIQNITSLNVDYVLESKLVLLHRRLHIQNTIFEQSVHPQKTPVHEICGGNLVVILIRSHVHCNVMARANISVVDDAPVLRRIVVVARPSPKQQRLFRPSVLVDPSEGDDGNVRCTVERDGGDGIEEELVELGNFRHGRSVVVVAYRDEKFDVIHPSAQCPGLRAVGFHHLGPIGHDVFFATADDFLLAKGRNCWFFAVRSVILIIVFLCPRDERSSVTIRDSYRFSLASFVDYLERANLSRCGEALFQRCQIVVPQANFEQGEIAF